MSQLPTAIEHVSTQQESSVGLRKGSFASCHSNYSTDDQQGKTQELSVLSKYKTELCRNFAERGWCPYDNRCRFAHGRSELHHEAHGRTTSQRFRKCKSFWGSGCCSYGMRCLFGHYQLCMREQPSLLRICWAVQQNAQEVFPADCRSRLLTILSSDEQSQAALSAGSQY